MSKVKSFLSSAVSVALGILAELRPADERSGASKESVSAKHELSDVHTKGIFWFALGLLAASVGMHLGAGWAFFGLKRHFEDPSAKRERKLAPEPRLQINPQEDLRQYLEAKERLLSSYGWVDEKRKVARIPIDRAMTLYLRNSNRRAR